jgi:hypothetical protein
MFCQECPEPSPINAEDFSEQSDALFGEVRSIVLLQEHFRLWDTQTKYQKNAIFIFSEFSLWSTPFEAQ